MRKLLTTTLAIVGIFFIVGYIRTRDTDFKIACAAYQLGVVDMGFPDNIWCKTFFHF